MVARKPSELDSAYLQYVGAGSIPVIRSKKVIMDSLEIFSRKIGIEKNSLKQALTHYSFYEDKDDSKANGRLIFKGMFVFKGQLADILVKYFSGNATQLQHILGNLFRNDYLNRLFDQWTLKKWVRASEKFDIKSHKHIFVYAIFGCIANVDNDKRRKFIFKYIINNENLHIFKHVTKNKDIVHQAKELAKITIGEKLKTKMLLTEDSLHKAVVLFNDGTIIAEATSKSYRYARKKAMKTTLEILSNINFDKYVNESNYLERVQKRIEEEKEKKHQELQQKLSEKEKKRLEQIEKAKRIKKARDLARKRAQAEAKKRKAEREKILAEKAAKEQRPLSAKKRRHLEDKRK
jgi:dsRNA-specific ribonuclease